ncbi:MAG: hypothetical protein [Caudoviricetes sp.]|nr:MAG: hypothetical protein [Caudoviricetes sp.]
MTGEKLEEMFWYGIGDGWGTIATGWECPHCDYQHDFVFYREVGDTVFCKGCGKESLTAKEMDW